MLPPMASSSSRPLPSSSDDIGRCCCPRTMHRCLPSTQTAVAFVEPQSPLSCRCRRLPSSYDAAVVVVAAVVDGRCRRRRTLPSSQDAAVVVGRYYPMPSTAAVVGCCQRRLLPSRMTLAAVFCKGVCQERCAEGRCTGQPESQNPFSDSARQF